MRSRFSSLGVSPLLVLTLSRLQQSALFTPGLGVIIGGGAIDKAGLDNGWKEDSKSPSTFPPRLRGQSPSEGGLLGKSEDDGHFSPVRSPVYVDGKGSSPVLAAPEQLHPLGWPCKGSCLLEGTLLLPLLAPPPPYTPQSSCPRGSKTPVLLLIIADSSQR